MTLTVNGEAIPAEMITAAAEQMRPQFSEYAQQSGEEPNEEILMEWAQQNTIEQILLKQEAVRRDEEIPPEAVESVIEQYKDQIPPEKLEIARKDIETQVRVQRLVEGVIADVTEIADDEAKTYYDENSEQFIAPEMVHAAHIVKHARTPEEQKMAFEEIEKAKDRLDAGETFESLAGECSDCGDNGGDLGYFPRGQMVEEFENVIFNMGVNEVSDIFLSPFGYHIAKLLDKKDSAPIPFEEVNERLQEHLLEKKRSEALGAFLDSLRKKAEIKEA